MIVAGSKQFEHNKHALRRALERAPRVCAGQLIKGIQFAVVNKRDDLVEYLGMSDKFGLSGFYRVPTPMGNAYPLVNNTTGQVITFYPLNGVLPLLRGDLKISDLEAAHG